MQPRTKLSPLVFLLLCGNLLLLFLLFQQGTPLWAQAAMTEQPVQQAAVSAYPAQKRFTGIHLGQKLFTRPQWSEAELAYIDPDQGGTWPSLLVIMSDQLYDIVRNDGDCSIREAKIRLQNDTDRPNGPLIYRYVKRAAQAGTKVVIRISPSPGNRGAVPAQGLNCDPVNYRTPEDVAREIAAIHRLNWNDNWYEYGFEPANEPNLEWFSDEDIELTDSWDDMDDYFDAVRQQVILHSTTQPQLFTPPMSQDRYAEGINWWNLF